jgi:glycosyltransferase 2 family protein
VSASGSKPWWILAGLVVGGGLLAVTLARIDIGETVAALRGVHAGYALLGVAASLTFVVFKAWRWSVLLRPFVKVRTRTLLPAVFAGTGVNLLIPHVGELVRIVALKDRASVPAAALVTTIGIERVFDLASVTLLVGAIALLQPALPPVVVSAGLAALALSAVSIGCVLGVLYFPRLVRSIATFATRWLPARIRVPLQGHVEDAISGFAALRTAHGVALAALSSIIQWLLIATGTFASILAVGLDAPAAAAIMVVALMVVGLTLPAAPINLGTTQAAFVLGLKGFGASSAAAVAASVVYTVAVLLPMLLGGLACLYFTRQRFGAVVARSSVGQQGGH